MMKYIKPFASVFLLSFYFLMCLITFKKKRICFLSFPDASDNSWYLYNYCIENNIDYELVWLVDEQNIEIKNKILSIKKSVKVKIVKRWSLKGLFYFCSSKVVFHTHGTYFFVRHSFNSPIIVNLWHGMPIKAIGLLEKDAKKIDYSDYSIATSNFYQPIIAQAFDLTEDRVLVTNLPRNDVLYNGLNSCKKQKLYESLNIKTNKNIVVWLPTYRKSNTGDIRVDGTSDSFLSDLDPNFLEELNEISLIKELYIVIKLHPMDALNIEKYKDKFSNISFYDSKAWCDINIELYDLLSISQGVISDFSSVIIDCIPTKIPVGIIGGSDKYYLRKVIIPLDFIKKEVLVINNPQDIIDLVFCKKIKNNFFNFAETENLGNSCDLIVNKFLN